MRLFTLEFETYQWRTIRRYYIISNSLLKSYHNIIYYTETSLELEIHRHQKDHYAE